MQFSTNYLKSLEIICGQQTTGRNQGKKENNAPISPFENEKDHDNKLSILSYLQLLLKMQFLTKWQYYLHPEINWRMHLQRYYNPILVGNFIDSLHS